MPAGGAQTKQINGYIITWSKRRRNKISAFYIERRVKKLKIIKRREIYDYLKGAD